MNDSNRHNELKALADFIYYEGFILEDVHASRRISDTVGVVVTFQCLGLDNRLQTRLGDALWAFNAICWQQSWWEILTRIPPHRVV